LNLVQRIAGAARLLATGKLAHSTGFDGAQMQRRLMAWRAGGESINSLILQGGELQRARARQLVRTNPYAANASASFTAHAVGCGISPPRWSRTARSRSGSSASGLPGPTRPMPMA
jgi:capsid protein